MQDSSLVRQRSPQQEDVASLTMYSDSPDDLLNQLDRFGLKKNRVLRSTLYRIITGHGQPATPPPARSSRDVDEELVNTIELRYFRKLVLKGLGWTTFFQKYRHDLQHMTDLLDQVVRAFPFLKKVKIVLPFSFDFSRPIINRYQPIFIVFATTVSADDLGLKASAPKTAAAPMPTFPPPQRPSARDRDRDRDRDQDQDRDRNQRRDPEYIERYDADASTYRAVSPPTPPPPPPLPPPPRPSQTTQPAQPTQLQSKPRTRVPDITEAQLLALAGRLAETCRKQVITHKTPEFRSIIPLTPYKKSNLKKLGVDGERLILAWNRFIEFFTPSPRLEPISTVRALIPIINTYLQSASELNPPLFLLHARVNTVIKLGHYVEFFIRCIHEYGNNQYAYPLDFLHVSGFSLEQVLRFFDAYFKVLKFITHYELKFENFNGNQSLSSWLRGVSVDDTVNERRVAQMEAIADQMGRYIETHHMQPVSNVQGPLTYIQLPQASATTTTTSAAAAAAATTTTTAAATTVISPSSTVRSAASKPGASAAAVPGSTPARALPHTSTPPTFRPYSKHIEMVSNGSLRAPHVVELSDFRNVVLPPSSPPPPIDDSPDALIHNAIHRIDVDLLPPEIEVERPQGFRPIGMSHPPDSAMQIDFLDLVLTNADVRNSLYHDRLMWRVLNYYLMFGDKTPDEWTLKQFIDRVLQPQFNARHIGTNIHSDWRRVSDTTPMSEGEVDIARAIDCMVIRIMERYHLKFNLPMIQKVWRRADKRMQLQYTPRYDIS